MIEFLENIDRELLFAFNGNNNIFWDTIMWWISEEIFGLPFYLLFIFLVHRVFGIKGTLIFILVGGATIGFTDVTAKYLFKEFFERYRPSQNLEIKDQLNFVNNYRGGTFGFISSHAANMFGITTLVFLLLKKEFSKIWWLIFLFPVIVSYSRVYLGVHYPSDVFVGGIWGVFIGWIMYRILFALLIFPKEVD